MASDVESERDAVSVGSDSDVHPVVHGLFAEDAESGRDDGGTLRPEGSFDRQPAGDPVPAIVRSPMNAPPCNFRFGPLANTRQAIFVITLSFSAGQYQRSYRL